MKSSMETVNNAGLLFLLLHLLFVIRILEHSRHFLQKAAEKKNGLYEKLHVQAPFKRTEEGYSPLKLPKKISYAGAKEQRDGGRKASPPSQT